MGQTKCIMGLLIQGNDPRDATFVHLRKLYFKPVDACYE